jgi:hypothetical protein
MGPIIISHMLPIPWDGPVHFQQQQLPLASDGPKNYFTYATDPIGWARAYAAAAAAVSFEWAQELFQIHCRSHRMGLCICSSNSCRQLRMGRIIISHMLPIPWDGPVHFQQQLLPLASDGPKNYFTYTTDPIGWARAYAAAAAAISFGWAQELFQIHCRSHRMGPCICSSCCCQ